MLDDAEPARLYRPRVEINIMAGLLAGLLLGVRVVFGMEYLDDTVKSADDIERVMGLRTLGAIPVGRG